MHREPCDTQQASVVCCHSPSPIISNTHVPYILSFGLTVAQKKLHHKLALPFKVVIGLAGIREWLGQVRADNDACKYIT